MRVDVHCHVGQRRRPCQPDDRFSFETPGEYAPFDACFSDRFHRRLGIRLGRWLMGLPSPPSTAPLAEHAEADARLEQLLLEHILSAARVDRVVALAFDQYHTTAGAREGSDLYVSNTYVRQLCRQHPERILFGASIHPYRAGAAAMLDEVATAGAVLIKWLPPVQNIDAEDARTVTFLRRAGKIGMPMLIHYGGEKALTALHPEYEDPSGLLRTLRRLHGEDCMPPVIVAHAATPATWPFGRGRYFRILVDALLGEFAEAPLYADISALGLFSRGRWLRRLIRRPELHAKLVHGSDFPIPPTPAAFWPSLGRRCWSIARIPSWIDRDVALKEALGVPEHVFTRGGDILRERIAAAGCPINSG